MKIYDLMRINSITWRCKVSKSFSSQKHNNEKYWSSILRERPAPFSVAKSAIFSPKTDGKRKIFTRRVGKIFFQAKGMDNNNTLWKKFTFKKKQEKSLKPKSFTIFPGLFLSIIALLFETLLTKRNKYFSRIIYLFYLFFIDK